MPGCSSKQSSEPCCSDCNVSSIVKQLSWLAPWQQLSAQDSKPKEKNRKKVQVASDEDELGDKIVSHLPWLRPVLISSVSTEEQKSNIKKKMRPGSRKKQTTAMSYIEENTLDCEDICFVIGNLFGNDSQKYDDCMTECEQEGWGGIKPDTTDKVVLPCPTSFLSHFELPDFELIDCETRSCFRIQYQIQDWPETSCCPPQINQTDVCGVPLFWPILYRSLQMSYHTLVPADYQDDNAVPATPTTEDRQLLGAALDLLIANMDIVSWVACLVGNWSLDVKGLDIEKRLQEILTPPFTWNVTYVYSLHDVDATMWAFTYENILMHPDANEGKSGLIVPIQQNHTLLGKTIDTLWGKKIDKWKQGGEGAFCAATQVAAIMLHEFVHIVGDTYNSREQDVHDLYDPYAQTGTLHEKKRDESSYEYPCWDEARMIESMFLWAMSQRYTCLINAECCKNMSDPFFVARSISTQDQIMADCQYTEGK